MKVLVAWPETSFLVLTFSVSLVCGWVAFQIGGESTFESPRAMPFLLLTIWSPTLSAGLLSAGEGRLRELLSTVMRSASLASWLIAVVPLLLAIALLLSKEHSTLLGPKTWALLLVMNLIMGPLGEEFGWRAYLFPRWAARFGPLSAALLLGAVWALWHLPLWFLPSPHRVIPYGTFFATVVSFSVLLAAAHRLGAGALLPCVVFHLLANVGVGWLELSGAMSAREAYSKALPVYALLALLAGAELFRAGSASARSASGCSTSESTLPPSLPMH